MKITKTKLAAASFGAALTSLYSAPELCAQVNDVVDLSFTPGTVPYFSGSAILAIPLQVVFGGLSTGFGQPFDLGFFNDSIGRTITGLNSFTFLNPGDVFTGAINAGTLTLSGSFFLISGAQTGIETVGFVLSGDAGFFRVDLQSRGPITFLDGQLAIGSSSIAIPEVPTVPEPSSVGLTALALGAAGLRRRRKTAKAA